MNRPARGIRFGRNLRIIGATHEGTKYACLCFKMPIPLLLQRVDVRVETKTEDNVFVQMLLAVRYYRLPNVSESKSTIYGADDDVPRQIAAAISDAVAACMPKIQIDDVFEKKREITDLVKREVLPVTHSFGYEVLEASVVDIRMRGSRGRWGASGRDSRTTMDGA